MNINGGLGLNDGKSVYSNKILVYEQFICVNQNDFFVNSDWGDSCKFRGSYTDYVARTPQIKYMDLDAYKKKFSNMLSNLPNLDLTLFHATECDWNEAKEALEPYRVIMVKIQG